MSDERTDTDGETVASEIERQFRILETLVRDRNAVNRRINATWEVLRRLRAETPS